MSARLAAGAKAGKAPFILLRMKMAFAAGNAPQKKFWERPSKPPSGGLAEGRIRIFLKNRR
jgi:hypothetical protein